MTTITDPSDGHEVVLSDRATGPTFTPGPWEIRRAAEYRGEGRTYPQVWTPAGLMLNGCGNIPGQDREANARLIVAAPDMYALLQAALDDPDSEILGEEWNDRTAAVLAKITGR